MSDVIQLNSENFDDFILNGKKPAVVDFSAEWCGPCKRLIPLIEEIAGEYKDRIYLCQIDIDEADEVAARYQITTIPSILFFKNGEVIERIFGLISKQNVVEKIISSLL